jgi:D-galactarolactone cycloisomerase
MEQLKTHSPSGGISLRIEKIEAYPIRVKVKDRLVAGTFRYDSYRTVLVRAVCDGQVGWGEAMSRFDEVATARMVGWIGEHMPKEAEGPEEAWQKVWSLFRVRGQTRGIAVEALSGVEIAMWDAHGRALREPLCRLLCRSPKELLKAYAGSVFESRGQVERQVSRVRELGLAGFKVKVGFGLERDVAILKEARRYWDDCMLVADANGAYGWRKAVSAARAFERYRLEWFEEPVPSDDMEGYRRLAGESCVPIGAGETWYVRDFDEPLEAGLVDVVEPSVSRCGGLLVEKSVAERALAKGIRFAPMVGANSSISLAASVHVAACTDALAVEYDVFGNPLVEELTPGFPSLKDGMVRVPSSHGLGIEVDESFVKRHAI